MSTRLEIFTEGKARGQKLLLKKKTKETHLRLLRVFDIFVTAVCLALPQNERGVLSHVCHYLASVVTIPTTFPLLLRHHTLPVIPFPQQGKYLFSFLKLPISTTVLFGGIF